jgi:spermidine/putrescine-binding protein
LTNNKKYLSLFLFFFIVGTLWGKFFYYSKSNRDALLQKTTLNLLAEEGFLPEDIIESFSLENNILIQITTYKDKLDLIGKLGNKTYDLIAFKSFYAKDVIQELSTISYKEIKNRESISADFKNPPYDPQNKVAMPLFWGIEKDPSITKPLLWVESIGVTKNSKFKKQAHRFMDYTLQSDVTVEVVRCKKIASTNRMIEKLKNVESKLKPSYLRKISIRDLAFADRASF